MGLIARIAQLAAAHGKAPALVHQGGIFDYRSLHGAIVSLAETLHARGWQVLALDLDNGPAFAVCDLAAYAARIAVLPLPPFFSAGQCAHALAAADAVITDDLERLRRRCPGASLHAETRLSVAGQALHAAALPGQRTTQPPDIAKITYTSGTTGEPRGVLLSRMLIESVASALAEVTEARPGDRCVALAPLAVLLENIGSLYVPLWSGATALLPPLSETGLIGAAGLDAQRMHRVLHDFRATAAIFSPQTLLGLVRVLERGASPLPDLRFAAVGGAKVATGLLERARNFGLPVYEGYGLSECASVVTLNAPRAHRPGSVGRPLPHVRVRIAAGGEVEIAATGMAGYLDAPLPCGADGWWGTGDLGRMDADGFLYLEGRRRNVLITSFGRNLASDWVEGELTQETAIAQAAVFGEAQPWLTALLVTAPGADARSLTAAVARANSRLPDYARVQHWLLADEAFTPANGLLTGTGRIRRDAVWARYGTLIETAYEERLAS